MARNALVRIALDDFRERPSRLAKLLHIAGEADINDHEMFPRGGDYEEYTRIRNRNILCVHFPLYATPPVTTVWMLTWLT